MKLEDVSLATLDYGMISVGVGMKSWSQFRYDRSKVQLVVYRIRTLDDVVFRVTFQDSQELRYDQQFHMYDSGPVDILTAQAIVYHHLQEHPCLLSSS